ncbi:MAG: hypothetical protein JWN20_1701, partial [Jatrophihabitantaceae bacterium]|nr:hypothetical protein [Jatrophihabitantaceae bacterium]
VGPQEELVEHGDVVGDEGGFVAADCAVSSATTDGSLIVSALT